MSKIKTKRDEATAPPAEPTQPEVTPANPSGWKFDAMASGIEKILATLFFRRLPSAAAAANGFARRDELQTQLEEFKIKHPAAKRLKELSDRWTKIQTELDAAIVEHSAAQEAFVDDPEMGDKLEEAFARVNRLCAQSDALAAPVETARRQAATAYGVFQLNYDSGRQERLKADCAAIAGKIEQAIAPLLNEFGAARDLLRQARGLQWPDFCNLFPTAPASKGSDKPLPQFNLNVGNVPVVADNTMRLPWTAPKPAPADWGRERPPIMPAMVPVEKAEQESETTI